MSDNKYIIDKDSLTGIADAIRDNQAKQFAYSHVQTAPAGSVLQVIYKKVVYSYDGSGSINVASLFPGLSFSYLFIRDTQIIYGSKLTLKDEDGNFITNADGQGLASCAVVPFSTNQYIPYTAGRSFSVNIDIFPLDQKMNHIIYDEEKHTRLSHINIDSRMTIPQQSSLIRLQDFGSNITNKKNRVYFFNDDYYNPIDIKYYGNGNKVPKMDLRYYGVNKMEDIKTLVIYPSDYSPIVIIPSWNLSRMDSLISGYQDLGYGCRPFLLSKSNRTPPFYSTNTSIGIFYKNGRLYSNCYQLDSMGKALLVV